MTEKIKLLIVDDHALVRRGLIAFLAGKSSVEVVGEAADGNEAIKKASALQPDVILLDLVMPQKDGITTIHEIKATDLPCKILVHTSFSSEDQVIGAIKAGADGYQLKDSHPNDLLKAIHAVHMGNTPFDPSINQVLAAGLRTPELSTDPGITQLTEKEIAVLELLARGLTDQQIGLKMGITKRTVSTHVSRILEKLGVENRTKAALYALKVDLINLEDINFS